ICTLRVRDERYRRKAPACAVIGRCERRLRQSVESIHEVATGARSFVPRQVETNRIRKPLQFQPQSLRKPPTRRRPRNGRAEHRRTGEARELARWILSRIQWSATRPAVGPRKT